MGLNSYLNMGARAVLAFQSGVASAGHNLSNASTIGFRRTELNLASELAPPGPGGIRSFGMTRVDDPILSRREREADGALGYARDVSEAATNLENALSSEALHDSMGAFFASALEASASPNDPQLRQKIIERAESLAASFGRLADSVKQSIKDANERLKTYSNNANELASELAALNEQVSIEQDPTLLDKRDQVTRELSELTGGYAIQSGSEYRFILEDGGVLVDGERVNPLNAKTDPQTGHVNIEMLSGSLTRSVSITGGKIGAQLDVRDNLGPGVLGEIDQLAFDFAEAVNTEHRSHAGLDGVSGRDFFDAPASVAGAASSMAVDATIAADPSLIAGAEVGLGPGDNTGLQALAAFSDGPYVDQAINTMATLGQEVVRAQQSESLHAAKSDALASMRDSLSGVSIEEEMTRLVQFQRATEASIKFIQTVDSMLSDLIEL